MLLDLPQLQTLQSQIATSSSSVTSPSTSTNPSASLSSVPALAVSSQVSGSSTTRLLSDCTLTTLNRFPQKIPNVELAIYEKSAGVGGTWYNNRYP